MNQPDFEDAFRKIKILNSEDLKELINDESKLLNIINNLPQIKNLSNEKERLLTKNKLLADFNLSFEPTITEKKTNLLEVYNEVAMQQQIIMELSKQIDSVSQKLPVTEIKAFVKASAQEKEKQAEALVEDFLQKELTVEEFLEQFFVTRATAHCRRIKCEKLQTHGTENGNYDENNYISTSWATPYPTNLPNMPMPSPFGMP